MSKNEPISSGLRLAVPWAMALISGTGPSENSRAMKKNKTEKNFDVKVLMLEVGMTDDELKECMHDMAPVVFQTRRGFRLHQRLRSRPQGALGNSRSC